MAETPHILIADDDPNIHKLIGLVLKQKGYSIQNVMSGDEVIQTMAGRRPDLLILDIMMPKVSGIELCQQIKENEALKSIPVLILSAKDTQEDRLRGLQLGADDYVSKPFHIASLVRKIETMIAKSAD